MQLCRIKIWNTLHLLVERSHWIYTKNNTVELHLQPSWQAGSCQLYNHQLTRVAWCTNTAEQVGSQGQQSKLFWMKGVDRVVSWLGSECDVGASGWWRRGWSRRRHWTFCTSDWAPTSSTPLAAQQVPASHYACGNEQGQDASVFVPPIVLVGRLPRCTRTRCHWDNVEFEGVCLYDSVVLSYFEKCEYLHNCIKWEMWIFA